jgi:deoxyribodipyrimidine photo-lyase
MGKDMRRDFVDREDLARYLAEQFPLAPGTLAETRGGYPAALAQLQRIEPTRYGTSRNFLNGAVTRLSPYIRHGVLSLSQVRDALLQDHSPPTIEKLLQELGWRDYWQRVYVQIGEGIWEDREPYKTGHRHYAAELTTALIEATTGLVCMDSFSQELQTTGYLHNHSRMWLAAYVIHWRRVRWQAGARWFLVHLLDGDPASNHLSWQWVASTFSSKPYFFNRENLERYSQGIYCQRCPHYGSCPFEGSYEAVAQRILPQAQGLRR